jgi:putative ABC transport system permease protein
MAVVVGALTLGFMLSLLALGVFISFRVFNFPDITTEGSFAFGAAVAAGMLISGANPLLATAAATAAGFAAGAVTGLLHARLKVDKLLSGILVMTALYSFSLLAMGKSNLSLLSTTTLYSYVERLSDRVAGTGAKVNVLGWSVPSAQLWMLAATVVLAVALCGLAYLFFRTSLGTAMRATGNNAQMIRALAVNTDLMLVAGLALANGCIALAGSLLAQYQGFADVQMGLGMLVWGIASIIIGETLIGARSLGLTIVGAVIGSVLFRLLVSIALRWGMNPNYLKLMTAVFVLAALVLPGILRLFARPAGTKKRSAGA